MAYRPPVDSDAESSGSEVQYNSTEPLDEDK